MVPLKMPNGVGAWQMCPLRWERWLPGLLLSSLSVGLPAWRASLWLGWQGGGLCEEEPAVAGPGGAQHVGEGPGGTCTVVAWRCRRSSLEMPVGEACWRLFWQGPLSHRWQGARAGNLMTPLWMITESRLSQ